MDDQLFTSLECRKFVKFSMRNIIYQKAAEISNKVLLKENSKDYWKQFEQDLISFNAIFDHFGDLTGRDQLDLYNFLCKVLFKSRKEIPNYSKTNLPVLVIGPQNSGKRSFCGCLANDQPCTEAPFEVLLLLFGKSLRLGYEKYVSFGIRFEIDYFRNRIIKENAPYIFILMGNPYSRNILTEFEDITHDLKKYSKGAEIIVVTSMKDLEASQPATRFISNKQANWFAYQHFGTLHQNITLTQLEDIYTVSYYCLMMKYFLANGKFQAPSIGYEYSNY